MRASPRSVLHRTSSSAIDAPIASSSGSSSPSSSATGRRCGGTPTSRPGRTWRDSIVENLTAARCLVIVFSEACNASKQLKKELAVADHLDKEVIPVLIEPTEPRGFFLYELAFRQWVSIYPAPREKLELAAEALVERLRAVGWSAITGVAPADPALSALPPPLAGAPTPPETSLPPPSGGRPPVRSRAPRGAARSSGAGAGRLSVGELFPFRWIDLVVPALVAVLALWSGDGVGDGVAISLLMFVSIIALTGLIVFPIRYYRRRTNPYRVAGGLVVLNLVFAVVASIAGFFLADTVVDEGRTLADVRGDLTIGLVAFRADHRRHLVRDLRRAQQAASPLAIRPIGRVRPVTVSARA